MVPRTIPTSLLDRLRAAWDGFQRKTKTNPAFYDDLEKRIVSGFERGIRQLPIEKREFMRRFAEFPTKETAEEFADFVLQIDKPSQINVMRYVCNKHPKVVAMEGARRVALSIAPLMAASSMENDGINQFLPKE